MPPNADHPDVAQFARRHIAGRELWRAYDFPPGLWSAMADAGLFRIGLTEGGYAAIAAADAALAEHGGMPGVAGIWTGHQLIARFMIQGFGTPEQKAAWLPGLASGHHTACVAISEPRVGAHPKHLATTGTADGDLVRLDGEKAWVSNATLADLFIVFAITSVEQERKRYSAYVVPRATNGLHMLPGREIASLRPSRHLGLRLDGCRVPCSSRLGPAGTAFEAMAMPFRDVEDAVGASGLVGTLRHLLRRLADATPPARTSDAATPLGALGGSVALAGQAAAGLAVGLDAPTWRPGTPPPELTGLRLLCANILSGIR
jgi:acyl-CoA dehydrogenase